MKKELLILTNIMNLPLNSTEEVFNLFKNEKNVVFKDGGGQRKFLYIEGTKKNKVCLLAHTDTIWHDRDDRFKYSNCTITNGIIKSNNKLTGIGADDRAGIAILYLLKNSGHSILLVDGEEKGMIGSSYLKNGHYSLLEHINKIHNFVIDLDRRGSKDFKCYDVGTDDFRKFLTEETKYNEPDRASYTDICVICETICGVNFSVGYYNEHSNNEYLVIEEWFKTYNMIRSLLKKDFSKFELEVEEFNVLSEDEYEDIILQKKIDEMTDEEFNVWVNTFYK